MQRNSDRNNPIYNYMFLYKKILILHIEIVYMIYNNYIKMTVEYREKN